MTALDCPYAVRITLPQAPREAAAAMKAGDAERLRELINESHRSLHDDFEVSNAWLNAVVEIAQQTDDCLGARMTGAELGGCAVAVVQQNAAEDFVDQVSRDYKAAAQLS